MRERTVSRSTLDLPAPPESIDLAALERSGVSLLRLTSEVSLGDADQRATLRMVALLRDAATAGLRVSWHGALGERIDEGRLVHLAPPEPVSGDRDPRVARWRQRHRPGLCFYRVGPGFVLVKDVRYEEAAARFRVDHDVAAFRRLESIVDLRELDAETTDLARALDAEGLLLRLGELVTLLPYRMRRWPVPAHEV